MWARRSRAASGLLAHRPPPPRPGLRDHSGPVRDHDPLGDAASWPADSPAADRPCGRARSRSYAQQPDRRCDSAERCEGVGRAVKGRTTAWGEVRGYEFHGLIGSNSVTDLLPPRTARLMQPTNTEVPFAIVGEDRGQVLRPREAGAPAELQRSMGDQRKQSPEGGVCVCGLYQGSVDEARVHVPHDLPLGCHRVIWRCPEYVLLHHARTLADFASAGSRVAVHLPC